jgi:hypothetical protein
MNEEFLHYLWKFQLFNLLDLKTEQGETLQVVKSGNYNTDAGPDFFNAKVKIGNTLWAGNVEVHINASDWEKHQHQYDKGYDNVILHLVYNADKIIYRQSGEEIPMLELKDRIEKKLFQNYLYFKDNNDWIPCQRTINQTPQLIINSCIDRMLIEKLEKKAEAIQATLSITNQNWEQTFYQFIARNFGFNVNADAFELLAKATPLSILAKHKSSLFQLEAILFGQAGMLEKNFEDEYPRLLQNEYIFLKKKYKLQSLDGHLWKFLRMRPANFPTIRIAQFAALIFQSQQLFSKTMAAIAFVEIKKLFELNLSDYWQTHYTFDKTSAKKSKTFGDAAINIVAINTIAPFMFVYGKQKDNDAFQQKAFDLLEMCEADNNSIINNWKTLGLKVENAYQSQALLHLKNNYCSKKKCLNCSIGNYLIKKM